jgi:PAS domain S-box-containing protein
MNDSRPDPRPKAPSREPYEELQRRLAEAEQALEAIRHGEVDALVVAGPQGERVYSLTGAEHIYRVIVETMHEAALTVDPEGTILFCNQRFCDLVKTPLQQVMGRNVTAFAARPQHRSLRRLLQEAKIGAVQRRLALRAADGTAVPVQFAASPLETGDHPSICLAASDLTELESSAHSIHVLREHEQALQEANERLQTQAEELETQTEELQTQAEELRAQTEALAATEATLRASESHLTQAQQIARLGSWSWDLVADRLYWSDEMYQLFGLTPGERVLRSGDFLRFVHPEDRQRMETFRQEALARGHHDTDFRIIRTDGQQRHVHSEGATILDEQGRAVRMEGALQDVTERRQAEEAVRQSEQRLRESNELLEAVTTGTKVLIATVDRDFRYTFFNREHHEELKRLTGKGTAIGMSLREALADTPEERDKALALWGRALNGETVVQTLAFGDPGRYRRWYSTRHTPIRDAHGEVIGAGEVTSDITDLVRAQEALRASEERFRALAEGLPLVVWSADAAGMIDYCNPWAYAYGGVRPDRVQGWNWTELVHPDDREATLASWRAALASGQTYRNEFRLRRADGEYRWHQNQGVPIRDAEGRVARWIGTAADIHDQKAVADVLERRVAERTAELSRAEQELRRAAGYNRTLIETSPDPLVTIGPDGKITDANRATEQFTGRARNELVGTDFSDYFTEAERARAGYREVFAKGKVHDYALDLRHRDGRIFHVLYNASVYRDEAGRVVGVFAAARDVTLRRQAEEAVAAQRQRLYDVLETLPAMICLLTPDYHVAFANRSFRERFGESNGRRCYEYRYGQEKPCAFCETYQVLETGQPHHWEVTGTNGRVIDAYDFPFTDVDGSPMILEMDIDITERKRAEAELRHRAGQLQRLTLEISETEDRERKRMAEILHDDLQQQLAAAKFRVSVLRSRAKSGAFVRATAAQIDQMLLEAIEKSRSLSHELSPAVMHHGDLGETCRWLAGQVQEKYALVAQVETHGTVRSESDALKGFLYKAAQEFLFNVVKHARVKAARLRVRRLGRYIYLSVSDRGRGFDPQGLRETTGFGLLHIRERVELLGGRMRIKSVPDKGCTLSIVVPDGEPVGTGSQADTRPNGRAKGAGPSAHDEEGRLRVLLADDHEIVREGLRSLLSDRHEVEVVGEAANGREAVDLALRLKPDVIIMDMSMPVMDGHEATRQIKACLPQTRVIAISMYDQPEKMEAMYRAGAERYVLKTAPSEELLAAIRSKGSDS